MKCPKCGKFMKKYPITYVCKDCTVLLREDNKLIKRSGEKV